MVWFFDESGKYISGMVWLQNDLFYMSERQGEYPNEEFVHFAHRYTTYNYQMTTFKNNQRFTGETTQQNYGITVIPFITVKHQNEKLPITDPTEMHKDLYRTVIELALKMIQQKNVQFVLKDSLKDSIVYEKGLVQKTIVGNIYANQYQQSHMITVTSQEFNLDQLKMFVQQVENAINRYANQYFIEQISGGDKEGVTKSRAATTGNGGLFGISDLNGDYLSGFHLQLIPFVCSSCPIETLSTTSNYVYKREIDFSKIVDNNNK